MDDLALVPSSEKRSRAETALPGTGDLEPLLSLVPPPTDPDLVQSTDSDPTRDYGPSPIAEWRLTFEANEPFDCATLATPSLGFVAPDISRDALQRQMDQAATLAAIAPKTALIVATHPDGKFWNGRDIWTLLHRLGLNWGDMDCFQWTDPTRQTDHLIWVEVDDGDLGYALPERIAAGTQHFRAIRFSLEIPRCPAPSHVLGQLERMALACQQALGCRLAGYLDNVPVSGPGDLRDGVRRVEDMLATCRLKPGSDSECRLI